MSDLAQIVSVSVATVIGYVYGVYSTRRALRDALDKLDEKK